VLKNNIYNIDREFDYSRVKSIGLKSLEKIAKEEALKNASNISDDTILNFEGNDDPKNVNNLLPPPTSPLLKLKIKKYNEISKLAYCCFKTRWF
jgi:hypothetical protein